MFAYVALLVSKTKGIVLRRDYRDNIDDSKVHAIGVNYHDRHDRGLILQPEEDMETHCSGLKRSIHSPSRKTRLERAIFSQNFQADEPRGPLSVPRKLLDYMGIAREGEYLLQEIEAGNKSLFYEPEKVTGKL